MKKTLLYFLTIITLSAGFTGCKRGEDDPALSFASRDGRLMRSWKLTAWDETDTYVTNGSTILGTVAYDGTIRTTTLAGFSGTESYSLEVTFDKNGICTVTEIIDGDLESDTSYWNWGNSDKKKSFISLSSSVFGGTYYASRLTSKELVIQMNSSSVDDPSGNNIDTETVVRVMTFEAI